MEIREEYITEKGNVLSNVREIAFTKDNYFGNLGTLVNETKKESDLFFGIDNMEFDDRGFYIYKSNYDDKQALRIYKCFSDYKFNGDNDDLLISKLQELQEKIKFTEFPSGVVTLDGRIIGQEIPYYEEYKTLYSINKDMSIPEVLKVYKKCLLIIKELNNKGINYLDVHAKNFMVDENLDVKLIDFENSLVKFNDDSLSIITLSRFWEMISKLLGNDDILKEFIKPESYDEAFQNIKKLEKKLI